MDKIFEFEGLVVNACTVGPLSTNCFVVGCTQSKEAAIVDAGFDAPRLLGKIEQHGLQVVKILQTHAHIDHVAALTDVKEETGAPIYLHPDDKMLYDAAVQQGAMFGYQVLPLPPVDEWLTDGDVVELGELKIVVELLPGHSPGSVAFHFLEQKLTLSGDVVFAGSMGRVDLPGSDPDAMRASMKKVKKWAQGTTILSGHGPETTIDMELKRNPFLLQDW